MFNKERFNEIQTKLKYNPNQSNLVMSNKYFRIFNQLVKGKKLKKAHIPYSFAYMYLITYLFRYTKYEDVVLSTKAIKELLGYSATNKSIDYITKQDGLLDSEGLTLTLFDFPVVHTITDSGELEFTMLSEFNSNNSYGTKWRQLHGINFNQSCKYPILGFYSNTDIHNEFTLNNLGGTYFNSSDTTMIPFEVFMYCMSHSELGVVGFYLYCYITYQVGLTGNCQMSKLELARNCNLSERTCQSYLNTLRQYNLIHTVVADKFIIGSSDKVKDKGEANTHFNNTFDEFIQDGLLMELTKPNYIHVSRLEKYDLILDTIDFDWS